MTSRYTVVVCPDCILPQVVSGDPETTTCGRCQKRLLFRKLKHFLTTEDGDMAREARGELLAKLQGYSEEYAELLESGVLDEAETSIEEQFLEDAGVTALLDENDASTDASGGSHLDIVRAAIQDGDPATEDSVLAYATARGVPRDKVVSVITRMHREGDILISNGTIRVL